MSRSNAAGVRNPVTLLPAAAELAGMPPDVRASLGRVFRQLSNTARGNANKAWRTHKAPMAAYWKACAVYSRHIALVLAGKSKPLAPSPEAGRVALLDQLRGILEDDSLSAADVYQCIADDILTPAGFPVRDSACPDDPDGLHHVGCGCES